MPGMIIRCSGRRGLAALAAGAALLVGAAPAGATVASPARAVSASVRQFGVPSGYSSAAGRVSARGRSYRVHGDLGGMDPYRT
jgi:hypothetical protein